MTRLGARLGARTRRDAPQLTVGLGAYIAVLAAGALVVTTATSQLDPPGTPVWLVLPLFVALLVAAEYFFVKFRYRGEVSSLNLVEAVMAPLIFAFPPGAVVASVVGAQLVAGLLRRNAPVRAAFNIAQWALTSSVAAGLVALWAPGSGVSLQALGAVAAALALGGILNHGAFVGVMAVAQKTPLRTLVNDLSPVLVRGWFASWSLNTFLGLLFLLAYAGHPLAVGLFGVPLAVLHIAYRGYAGARSDRARLAGLHSAANVLAAPLDPNEGIGAFLAEVAKCFEARAAALVLRTSGGRTIHIVERGGDHRMRTEADSVRSFEGAMVAQPGAVRLTASSPGLGSALREAGWRDCLAAPLVEGGLSMGALLVLDQAGLEGFEAGELAVVEALARETAATFGKGVLLERILEERRTLADIVSTASDGIFVIEAGGAVRSWNPAMERMTGMDAAKVVDSPGILAMLRPTTADGNPVSLEAWASADALPVDLYVTPADGKPRRWECSYSVKADPRGRSLIVVARDTTPEDEMRELRRAYGRLAAADAARREVVDQLQAAVMPAAPSVDGLDLGVAYVGSDPTSPTGGDLYDWHVLPSGDVHVAVVDVIGHGVAATKDALGVVHALRLLALQGCPLEELVARADALLSQERSGLVATVLVARYSPATGRVRLVSGGHPPALHVSVAGGVRQVAAAGGALGWPAAGSDGIAELVLEPGDALVFYTDGLVETNRNILEGTDALMTHARRLAGRAAFELAAELLDRSLEGGSRRDDSLALVLRRVEPERTQGWRLPPDAERVSEVRRSLSAWLENYGVAPDVRQDLQLVTSELLANAVKAARERIDVRLILRQDTAILEVSDDGHGRADLDRLGLEPPGAADEAGRGLYIARTLSDGFSVLSTSEGTLVHCERRLVSAPKPAVPEPDHQS